MIVTTEEIKDMINDKGFNVSEAEVKQVIQLFFPAHVIKSLYVDLNDEELSIVKNMLTQQH